MRFVDRQRREGVARSPRSLLFFLVLAILALVAAACDVDDPDPDEAADADITDTDPDPDAEPDPEEDLPEDAEGDELSIAFLASSSQNAYNQAVYEGVVDQAEETGGVSTQIFDGQFNAEVQFNQVEDIIAGGQFDGLVIVPNDTVGIVPALEQAIDAGLAVATALFPVGSDLTTLEPQIEGLTTTAAAPPTDGARAMAEAVAEYCADLDPCRVVVLVGQLQFPFDNLRYETWLEVLEQHDNIEIVATGEGNYDRDTSLGVMQDILQAHPEIDAILSGADQHLFGAEIALEDAGHNVEDVYTIGLGAAREAVQRIRDGRWDATYINLPYTEGYLATEQVINQLRGDPVEPIVDIADPEIVGVPPLLTQEVLEEHPDFEGEFDG